MMAAFLEEYYNNLKENKLSKFISSNEKKIYIDSIYDFLEIVDILENEKNTDVNNVGNEYYYRGVGDSSWGLEPSIMFNNLEWCESKMIREFKQLWPDEFNDTDNFNVVAKMQHFGLPTRLLDFTTNPMVALYFACCNEPNNDGKVFLTLPRYSECIREQIDIIFDPIDSSKQKKVKTDLEYIYTYLSVVYGINKLYFKRPDHVTEREKRQSSIFMLFANNIFNYDTNRILSNAEATGLCLYDDERSKLPKSMGIHNTLKRVESIDFDRQFIEIIVPASIKQVILENLSRIGIKKSFLFPEIEYTAEYLKKKYLNINRCFENNNFNEEYDY